MSITRIISSDGVSSISAAEMCHVLDFWQLLQATEEIVGGLSAWQRSFCSPQVPVGWKGWCQGIRCERFDPMVIYWSFSGGKSSRNSKDVVWVWVLSTVFFLFFSDLQEYPGYVFSFLLWYLICNVFVWIWEVESCFIEILLDLER